MLSGAAHARESYWEVTMAKLRRYRRDKRGRFAATGSSSKKAGKPPMKPRSEKATQNKRSRQRADDRLEGALKKDAGKVVRDNTLTGRTSSAQVDKGLGTKQFRNNRTRNKELESERMLKAQRATKAGDTKEADFQRHMVRFRTRTAPKMDGLAKEEAGFNYGKRQLRNVASMQLKELERERRTRRRRGAMRGGL